MPGARAIADSNGNVRFSLAINDNNKRVIFYKSTKDKNWQEFNIERGEGFEGTNVIPLGFSPDNKQVCFSANVKEGTRALYTLDLEGKVTSKLFHNKDVDMSQFIFDVTLRNIIAVGTELTVPQYHYVDKKSPKAKLHKALMAAFAGSDVIITSSSEDGKRLIAYVYSDTNPEDYYLFETKSMNAQYLASSRSWINPDIMAPTEFMTFKTLDNAIIHGYLTRPISPGTVDKIPMVVVPHGGPHQIRDEWGFNWEVQLLANRGYAVLQVNFRGSAGFGKRFRSAGYGKWGTLMQDDITDATQSIIRGGNVDSKRICILGASYGGYAALMGAAREKILYKCAIDSMGIYDLPMMFTEGNIA